MPDDELHTENFNLSYHLGPVFDIIRYERAKLPMAIGIYGTWCTGKTTAMKWLDSLLKRWKDSKASKDKITKEVEAEKPKTINAEIVRQAVAKQLIKKPDELTREDYHNIIELDLSGSEISDLEPIKNLTSLEMLSLSNTSVPEEQIGSLKKVLPKLRIIK